MQYKCDKGHLFIHVAKQTHFLEPKEIEKDEDTTCTVADAIERSVCPFCFSPFVKEHVDAKGDITALIEVPHAEVNDRITEGYVVMEDKIYAKSTIMCKRALVEGME